MTPKEKANELGNKFYQGSVFDYDKQGHLDEKQKAKNRALIANNELLEYSKAHGFIELTKFHEEVKQEIEKL